MSLLMDWRTCERHVIRGLDHLGISAFSIAVYNILLPGITNVTDRARYYSLYPWIIHDYAKSARFDDRKKWLSWYRRLDFAYALATTAADLRGDGSARGIVGADRARAVLRNATETSTCELVAADLDAQGKVPKGAYFKNPQGGYGQYYKAVLRDLGLFFEDEKFQYPDMQLTTYAGVPLAQSVDAQPAFAQLRDIAFAGAATAGDLASVGALVGPSAIIPSSREHGLLCRLFWGEDDSLCRAQSTQSREWRRKTLLAILSFIEAVEPPTDNVPQLYRRACAQQLVSDETAWRPPDSLSPVIRGWADYQWNEFFNYAMETLLWAVVQVLRDRPLNAPQIGRALSAMAVEGDAIASAHLSDVGSFIKWSAGNAGAADHSVADEVLPAAALQDTIEDEIRDGNVPSAVQGAVRMLGYLVSAPSEGTAPMFSTLPGAAELFESHRIHLPAWRRRVHTAHEQRLDNFLQQLVIDWVVNRHLRVATRKLASQGVHTFKFAPEEDALVCLTNEELIPGPTNPRLRQGLQILQDLGYVADESKRLVLTTSGRTRLGGLQ